MIIVEDVHKRYQTDHGPGKWVLQGVTFTIPPKLNVGLIGANGAGKSTLLRIIGGVDQPTRGRVERHSRVSWPMGFGGGLQGSLTGRQNAKFVCRIHGHEAHIPERLAFHSRLCRNRRIFRRTGQNLFVWHALAPAVCPVAGV